MNHLMEYLCENNYSPVAPFLERFFEIIDKLDKDKITFDEFFPALCAFALFTRQEMLAFVFTMLDRDKDSNLTKVDLQEFVSMQRGGFKEKDKFVRVFPKSVILDVNLYQFPRGDEINLQDFSDCVIHVPYLVFPAFRLQDQIQEKFGGTKLWKKCQQKIDEQEKLDKIEEFKSQFMRRKLAQIEQEYQLRLEYYKEQIKIYNEAYYKK